MKNEIKNIGEALGKTPSARSNLITRVFHLTDAIENAGPQQWGQIDWNGFLRIFMESGIAFDILGAGKCVIWASEAGLLSPSFCFEPQKESAFEQMSWGVPKLAVSTLSDKNSWSLWLEPEVEKLGLDNSRFNPKFGSWLADVSAEGFGPPKLVGKTPLTGFVQSGSRFAMRGVDTALDKA